jgi:hypothetical protein
MDKREKKIEGLKRVVDSIAKISGTDKERLRKVAARDLEQDQASPEIDSQVIQRGLYKSGKGYENS